jgi:Platelet-activating factor acetylhydrolase, isoform II
MVVMTWFSRSQNLLWYFLIFFVNFPLQAIILPAPTGSYFVGMTHYHCIDTTRIDIHDDSRYRELMISIIYPTSEISSKKWSYADGIHSFIKKDLVSSFQVTEQQVGYVDAIESHALIDVPLVQRDDQFPLILFCPGYNCSRLMYTSLLEDLASHGFVVVSIDFPYLSNPVLFPDGRVIERSAIFEQEEDKIINQIMLNELDQCCADISFILDILSWINSNHKHSFREKFDLDRIGIFGHSFGGIIALYACSREASIVSCANLDGDFYGESVTCNNGIPLRTFHVTKPYLFMYSSYDPGDMENYTYDEWLCGVSLMQKISDFKAFMVQLNGVRHEDFGDWGLICSLLEPAVRNPLMYIQLIRTMLRYFFRN